MALSCRIKPKVRNKQGEEVDSKLYNDLLSLASKNRSQALNIYSRTINNGFMSSISDRLKPDDYDENGEVKIGAFLRYSDVSPFITDMELTQRIAQEEGLINLEGVHKTQEYTALNAINAYKKAFEFNQNSKYAGAFYQEVVIDRVNNTITNKISRNTSKVEMNIKQMNNNYELYSKMLDILKQAGITVGNLTSMEERLGINGVTDFDACKDMASGLVEMIRLAKGEKGLEALPEEFAHAVIELLGDNPLTNRLYNVLQNDDVVKEVLGKEYKSYYKEYEGDRTKLMKEAAGKLVAQRFLHPEVKTKSGFDNLIDRIVHFIKQLLGRIDVNQLQKAINDADHIASTIAQDVLEGRLTKDLKLLNVKGKEMLYSLDSMRAELKKVNTSAERHKVIVSELIQNLVKESLLLDQKLDVHLKGESTKQTIKRMEATLCSETAVSECINHFLKEGSGLLSQFIDMNTGVINQKEYQSRSLDDQIKQLSNLRLYYESFDSIFTNLDQIISELPLAERDTYQKHIRPSLDQAFALIRQMKNFYHMHAKKNLVKKLEPFWTDFALPYESYIDSNGKKAYRKGEVITLEKILTEAENGDISAIDRWFESMGTSNDSLLRLADKIAKYYKEKVRDEAIECKKQLLAAGLKLEQAGIANTEWMFERYSDDTISDNYITELNWSKFWEERKHERDRLDEKYGKNPEGMQAQLKDTEYSNWLDTHMKDGKPLAELYPGEALNLSGAKKEYYDAVMKMKEAMANKLPEKYRDPKKAVFIRKDALERIKSSGGILNSIVAAKDAFWDALIVRSDDNDFGGGNRLLDFNGNEIQSVPILYTGRKKGDRLKDLSTDVTTSMIAYCEMAINYEKMNTIADTMSLLIETARDRDTAVSKDNKAVATLKKFGHTISHIKQGSKGSTHIEAKLRDYVDMHIYGIKEVDEGSVIVFGHKVSVAKLADNFNWLTSQDTLALNFLSNISNITTGMSMMEAEMIGGRYVKRSNYAHADLNFFRNLPRYIGEMNDRVKTSKLALFAEKFNVLQKFESEIRDVDFNKKGILRMFGSEILFLGQDAGEFYMQMRTAMALADTVKFKDASGNEVTLWDAYEAVPIDPNNPSLGSRFQLKKGLTKPDGTAWTQDDEIKFTNKAKFINQQMHGVYNVMDRAMIQRYAFGRMFLMYRKYIVPGIQRRYGKLKRNEDLEDFTEGFYRSFGRFLSNAVTGVRNGQIGLAANWNAMTDLERQNCKKAIFELAWTVLLCAVIACAYGGLFGDGDKNKKKQKKERSYFDSLLEYQCRRLFNEVAAFTPTHWGVFEIVKLMDSPMAGISTLQKIANILNTLNPYNYETFAGKEALIDRGYWKGYSKAQKLWLKYIPYYGTITNFLDVEGKIQFFKQ